MRPRNFAQDDDFDPYHKWLGIPKDQRPPTFYQLLAVAPDEWDSEVIQSAAKQREDYVRKFVDGPYKTEANSLLFELQEARVTLLNPKARDHYDSKIGLTYQRQAKNSRRSGQSLVSGGAVSVGEGSELTRQFVGIMAVILGGFIIMAVVAFRLHWTRLPQDETVAAAATEPAPQARNSNSPKVVPPTAIPSAVPFVKGADPPVVATVNPPEIKNSIGMKLRLIPAGEFQMGSPPTEQRRNMDEQQHRVQITQPFYLGIYEVTRGEFRKFVEATGYRTEPERDGAGGWGYDAVSKRSVGRRPKYSWRSTGFQQTDEHPIVNVTWNDAVKFCEWLHKMEGKAYRLPTEAEWEYACRGGMQTTFQGGDHPETQAVFGNVWDGTARAFFSGRQEIIRARDGYVFTASIGQFRANKFGLHDMQGNVWEWCSDWYNAKYYASSPTLDPQGPQSGSTLVVRGGGWGSGSAFCRSARRLAVSPLERNDDLGFRLALSPRSK